MTASKRPGPEGSIVRTRRAAADPELARRLRALGELLDNSIPVPGTRYRIGLDALIGLVPGIGDLVGTALSGYIILQATRFGLPAGMLARMLLNVGVEAVIGAVPLLGDLFDAGWKANVRNLTLLQRHLDDPRGARRSSRRFLALAAGGLVLLLAGTGFLLVELGEAIARLF
ncbi:MAG TPA: DUF4112 domain-containing protein [Gemmatimonadales bacterium]|nr:DUF4112 domain-containing protein [Gemmatimonadales bacterium]